MKLFGPIILVVIGIFLLIGGDAVASSEENVSSAVGSLVANKFFAFAVLAAGGFWLWSETGHFKRIAA